MAISGEVTTRIRAVVWRVLRDVAHMPEREVLTRVDQIDAIIASVPKPEAQYLPERCPATWAGAPCSREKGHPGKHNPDNAPEASAHRFAPEAQHHDAPTCAGAWYVRNGDGQPWRLIEISQEHWRKQIGTRAYAQYYGPLLPPDGGES